MTRDIYERTRRGSRASCFPAVVSVRRRACAEAPAGHSAHTQGETRRRVSPLLSRGVAAPEPRARRGEAGSGVTVGGEQREPGRADAFHPAEPRARHDGETLSENGCFLTRRFYSLCVEKSPRCALTAPAAGSLTHRYTGHRRGPGGFVRFRTEPCVCVR